MRLGRIPLALAALLLAGGVGAARADTIVEWNAIAAQNMTGTVPLPHTREFAILHLEPLFDRHARAC